MKKVFAQRGNEVAFEDMKQRGTYLLDQSGKLLWNWIVDFDELRKGEISHIFSLASNGIMHEDGVIEKRMVTTVFEATPDQKHLLMQTKMDRIFAQRGEKVETPAIGENYLIETQEAAYLVYFADVSAGKTKYCISEQGELQVTPRTFTDYTVYEQTRKQLAVSMSALKAFAEAAKRNQFLPFFHFAKINLW